MPTAAALFRPLAWELPYAAGAALKRKINKQTRSKEVSFARRKSRNFKNKEKIAQETGNEMSESKWIRTQ